jgi:hypothetical protein
MNEPARLGQVGIETVRGVTQGFSGYGEIERSGPPWCQQAADAAAPDIRSRWLQLEPAHQHQDQNNHEHQSEDA